MFVSSETIFCLQKNQSFKAKLLPYEEQDIECIEDNKTRNLASQTFKQKWLPHQHQNKILIEKLRVLTSVQRQSTFSN